MSGARPRVSVILPCYNGEIYLREAVQSILDQTLADFELIVVDDGSTDGSPAILQDMAGKDARIRVVTQPNGGIVAALNTAIEHAQGQYIARMDADDVSFPERLAFQASYLDQHPDVVLVGGYAVGDRNPTPASTRTTGGRHASTDLSVFPPRVAVSMHPLIMMRAAALRAMGGYRSDYRHAEDYDLFIRASAHGRIENPPVDVLFYRRHEGAISIGNVEEQERSAVRAELDAIARTGAGRPPALIVEAYTRLRIFRRYRAISAERVRAMRLPVLASLVAITPRSLLSSRFRRLPLLIGVALVRSMRTA
ncbi:glycosyl transferase [Novosphingobium barchaimii LL02]|uniref:Glycosyl transferase n=1 Tax=Novosphingobium barchaimii LL02 TaxID=1114963 RepID=A0A0J7XTF6_9SPHN|nr:glycosyltransferase [Novosphingobium barchaimii]KMS55096.1 glycosyl transferase [Novosphingobium barchaimii LL02]